MKTVAKTSAIWALILTTIALGIYGFAQLDAKAEARREASRKVWYANCLERGGTITEHLGWGGITCEGIKLMEPKP